MDNPRDDDSRRLEIIRYVFASVSIKYTQNEKLLRLCVGATVRGANHRYTRQPRFGELKSATCIVAIINIIISIYYEQL